TRSLNSGISAPNALMGKSQGNSSRLIVPRCSTARGTLVILHQIVHLPPDAARASIAHRASVRAGDRNDIPGGAGQPDFFGPRDILPGNVVLPDIQTMFPGEPDHQLACDAGQKLPALWWCGQNAVEYHENIAGRAFQDLAVADQQGFRRVLARRFMSCHY